MDNAFDWIVATKFHPPAPHGELLPRPRLAEALAEALASRRLTILSAPAGSGKTTLLAEALRAQPLPAVWLALDADDNDPARFALGLLAGVGRARPGVGDLARSLLSGLDAPAADLRRVLGVLINELLETPKPLLLVFDDLHVIEEPAVLAGLEFLLERMPPGLRLAATARAEPPLALARLRAQRQLAEFRLDDLCFTPEETAALLNERLGLGLPAGELGLVQSATAGWAAGLGLVAGSLDRRAPAAEGWLLDALGRAGGFMFDFLAEEVLRREDPAVRRFLLDTSVLIELTPALCAAVTGRDDAARLLETVRARNLFVAEIGGPRRVARYHPLFAGFLLAQLEREDPGRAAALRLRAAAAEPSAERALGYELAAGAWEPAAARIEQLGEQAVRQGLLDQVRGWIEQLPAAARSARPRLAYLLGLCLARQGRLRPAEQALAEALAGFEAAGDDGGRGAALAELAAMAFLAGEFERSGRLVDDGLALPGELAPATRMALLLGRSRLAFVRRQWPLAQQSFDQALALCEREGDPAAYALLLKYANLTMIAGLPGGLERMERLVRGAESWPVGPGGFPPGPAEIALDAHRAIIALWRGELARSIEAGERARTLARRLGGALPHLALLLPALLGMVHLACGHDADAEACFAEALARIEQGTIAAPLVAGALCTLARARLLQGRAAEAQLIYERLVALDPGSVPALPFLVTLLRGMLALAGERFGEAEQALGQAVMIEQMAGGTTLIFGSARLALAQFHLRRGRQREALAELAPALEECARERRLGLVLREGRAVVPLLRLAAGNPGAAGGPLAVELLRLLGAGAAPRPLRDPLTGETLSAREVEVLRLLLDGSTNQQIADALTISLPTVKTHLLHIFQKLQVRTRTQAAARARELLPPA